MSGCRMVSDCEYQTLSAPKMLHVPSVTMKGGSFSRVTISPLTKPHAVPTSSPSGNATATGTP